MPYVFGYFLLFFVLNLNYVFGASPTLIWVLGYVILFLTIRNKNPFDPQAWMFFSWGVLFVNIFSGVIYIPANIDFLAPMFYVILTLFMFHCGFLAGKTDNFRFNKNQVRNFLYQKAGPKLQWFITILGILTVIGALAISFEMFVIHGMSFNGGERRAEVQSAFKALTPLTTLGVILIGGCYISALSLFFGGNSRNKFLAITSIASIALASVAIAGKQGILIAILIILFGFLVSKYYRVKLKIPIYVKTLLVSVCILFILYISILSSERHGNVGKGELLTESSRFNQEFIDEMNFLPATLKNTFAEFFGYYGDQLCTFSERWELDDYPNIYSILELPPRVLNPFTWFERQVAKILPFYNTIYPPDKLLTRIANQNNGYFSLANWQTTLLQGIKIFGFAGQLIVVFFHGYYSRRLFEKVGKNISFTTLHMCLLNSIFLVYTIMMNFLGETSAFFYLAIILFLHFNSKIKTKKINLNFKYS